MESEKESYFYTNLAYKVLKESGEPMHYVNITQEVLKVKQTKGKTPQQTLRALIAKDERFVKVDRGTYGLKEWEK